ncbi:MAG: T9SS type A sorting domain-containing protein [Bacteroidales bacterium]|nr:T9SS type A sorting domain-containing protein [Bacteroidales bacterium]MCF8403171.1 T9SS type A sorting domain-containing protein [Bacteroidales bacterium]
MKKLLLFSFTMVFSMALFSQILYEDNFDSYTLGSTIAVENPTWWSTWSGTPGSSEDAVISDEQSSSPSQSLKVENLVDNILLLGNKIVGKYKLSFKYYVVAGNAGYFNIQHFESPGIEWAYEVYFGATGAGYLSAGSEQVAGFTFAPDTWVEIENVIDLDNDWTQLYVDGALIYEWPFSWQFNSQSGTLQLGAMDMWAGGPTGETPLYYFDDVVFEAVPSALYEDDFEAYTVGDYIAVVNPDWWTTWSGAPGGTEDALITDEQANSGTNSIKVDGVTDLIIKLGDETSGKYQLSFYMYVPAGFGGYYNLQHFESPGIEWAYEVYFGATGAGYLSAGSDQVAGFTYTPDSWVFCDQIIDLNTDWTQLYIDGSLIYEWPFSWQATSQSGTLQLGGVDVYAGAPTGETATYYFDDVEFIQLEPGSGAAIINVDPTVIVESVNAGNMTSTSMEISNSGEEALDYDIVVTYPGSDKKEAGKPSTGNSKVLLSKNVQGDPTPQPGGAPAMVDDVILNYDGDNVSAVGLTSGGIMRVAAVFTPDEVGDYIGMELSAVEVYINDAPIETKAQVYNYGLPNIPGPGELLYEQSWNSLATSWQIVDLNDPVTISGGDIWVGYWVDHAAATFPAGTDGGPHHPNGDWIASGPGWHHLSDNAALDYNWNIRAYLSGDAITQWLSVSPESGTVDIGMAENIDVNFDATDLTSGSYYGELVVNNSDPENPQVIIPVNLGVLVGVNEFDKSAVMIYPNPTVNKLNVKADAEINSIELFNMMGQLIERHIVSGSEYQFSTEGFESGMYIIKIELDGKTMTERITIK